MSRILRTNGPKWKELREKTELSQAAAAEKAGISESTIRNIEKGTGASQVSLECLAAVFGAIWSQYLAPDDGPAYHPCSGGWHFTVTVSRWRHYKLRRGESVVADGTIYLLLPASGANGEGFAFGNLCVKLRSPNWTTKSKPFYTRTIRVADSVQHASCDAAGHLKFQSTTFVRQALEDAEGVAPTGVPINNDQQGPREFIWEVRPTSEPDAMEGIYRSFVPNGDLARVHLKRLTG